MAWGIPTEGGVFVKYESPVLFDLEDLTAGDGCGTNCSTGGNGGTEPVKEA